ncbi:MAG: prepilin-type N-terminal cleavage/methylation domain-containing protein [Lachnospiraceae bacterium]|nr:prepilin-type N-terminal cleavage/methylation domain-containing protein [Lachnospiraceae bacterium]
MKQVRKQRKSNARKLNKDAGFSLLELLIAVIILAIIVIPLLNLFLSSNRLNIKSRQTLRATTAAQDIMEGLKAYDMEEIKAQFKDPASGFYVIDSRMIKGGVKEEFALEKDGAGNPAENLYVFSMEELNMQGSKFDAKIVADGRGYMDPARFPGHSTHSYSDSFFKGEKCTVCGAFKDGTKHEGIFNDAAMADARSIDKKNGTFVESDNIRQAVMDSVFADRNMEKAIKDKLKASGVADTALSAEYDKLRDPINPNMVCYKNAASFFTKVSRTIEVTIVASSEKDENGVEKAAMEVDQTYTFTYKDLSGGDVTVTTKGSMDSGYIVDKQPCGNITRIVDEATGDQKINVNIFYYPLYGASVPDEIIVKNGSGADLNLLIAKQRHDTGDPADRDYLMDSQLMAAEQAYRVNVKIQDGGGSPLVSDRFSLKTNLGLNLVGKQFMGGVPGSDIKVPTQLTVNGTNMDLSGGSNMNIFTLDGVRSPMGKPAASGEITELIYDVEVSVYEEGAAVKGFPDDMRMIVIGGSTTN